MNVIIYGSQQPKISFKQSPDGSISFHIENQHIIQFDEGTKEVNWRNMYENKWIFYDKSPEELNKKFTQYEQEIVELTTTKSERKFFLGYTEQCRIASKEQNKLIWDFPALIPQVWVNWIHYDPKDPKRAARAQKEPFRVDFMLKDNDISPNFIIFEIDGSSHFGGMQAYTEHLRKDRWLRNQGWEVIRISNLEVEEYGIFNDFFAELTGKYMGMPF